MHDPTAVLRDRTIAILRDAPAVTMPLPELARRLGVGDTDGLVRALAGDPRVVVLGPSIPGLTLAERADDYEHALAAAGFRAARRVALLHPTPTPVPGVAGLLRETTARLLDPTATVPGAARLAEAAERAHRAVVATGAAGAAPSTTPLPGPRPPPPDPPRRPRGASRRPPRP